MIAVLVVIIIGFGGLSFQYFGSTTNSEEKNKIVAFCGSASKPALEAAADAFENKTGTKVELHFSGSGNMLSQMKMSKSGDLYIPGSPDYMIRAIEDNVVYPETAKRIAYLVPAIVTPEGNPENISDLDDLMKPGIDIGIGNPESVCVGEYAIGVLKNADLYDEVNKNIVVHAESCSKTANLAVIGKVDCVIGWRVFHEWNEEKTEVVYIEPNKIPKIAYVPAAISKYTQNRDKAEKFIEYLTLPEGRKFFKKYGYIPTEEDAREYAPNAEILSFT